MQFSGGDFLKDGLVKTLQELILIESDLHSDLQSVVRYVADRLSSIGMDVSILNSDTFPVLTASYGEEGILFSGHLDTVPIGSGWSRDQSEIIDNKIYGRGSADMKGGCAAILECAEHLVNEKIPFSICFTTDEEEQMYGAEVLAKSELVKNAPAIIICEPTSVKLVHKEKGFFRFNLVTNGTSAHASQPWLGRDAILKMHYCIDRLLDLVEASSQKKTGTSMCITTIHGGDKNNVVTDICTVEIDVRYQPPTTYHDVQDLIVNRLRGESYELTSELILDAFESNMKDPLAKELIEFLNSEVVDMPYVTEAPYFAKVNPRVFICGPGDPQMAHVVDEFVEIEELEGAYDMLIHAAKFTSAQKKNKK